jgi:hypothetical protein
MPGFIDRDCQAIYLGSPSRDDLVRAVGRLAYNQRAPTALTDIQKVAISNDPRILELGKTRRACVAKIKDLGYPTIKAAEGTTWYKRHRAAQTDINSLKRQLSESRVQQAIREFHDTIDTIEVNKQLQGLTRPTEVLTPSTVVYELKERATVAKIFFQSLDNLTERQLFHVRAKLTRNLIKLCRRHETPRQHKASTSRNRLGNPQVNVPQAPYKSFQIDDAITDVQESPESVALYCPFCRWCDEEASPQKRNKLFARIDGLRKHVRGQHLDYMVPDKGLKCPYQGCTAFLGGKMHFLSHTALEHGLFL